MSRVLYKKKNPQRLAAFREGHNGIKHGTQAWLDDGSGSRTIRQFNTELPQDTSWDERWMTSENFRKFESTRKLLRARHKKGEHIEQALAFEEVLHTESVGHRNPGPLNPGVSGLGAYA
jgi:hypothetical protein